MIGFIRLVIIFTFLSVQSFSIDNDSTKQLNYYSSALKLHYGKLLDIYPNYPSTKQFIAIEAEFNLHTTGAKIWHQLYGFPEIGLSAIYTNLGNKEILGYGIGLFPHIKLSTKIFEKLYLKYKLGLGIAYLNKPFNEITNPENFVVGGHFSSIVTASFLIKYKLNTNNYIVGGGSFVHYSNGHVKVPNVGINAINMVLGFKHLLTSEISAKKIKNLEKGVDRIHLGLTLGIGIHEFEGGEFPTGGPKYPLYMGSIYLTSRIGRKRKLSTGIDINYYTAYHDFIISKHLFKKRERLKSASVVYFLGHEYLLGRLSLLVQLGLNIYNPFNIQAKNNNIIHREKPNLYSSNKFGFRYYFTPLNFKTLKSTTYIGINIKSHVGVADLMEFNVGYLF